MLSGLHLKYVMSETVPVVRVLFFSLKNYALFQMFFLKEESSLFRQA